jgi:hypothetical protein
MIPVVSSNIRAAKYDAERCVIVVQFLSGETYECGNQVREAFLEFMAAPSKGRFYRENLAGSARRLTDGPTHITIPADAKLKTVSTTIASTFGPARTFDEDECCKILKAAFKGELEGKRSWTCPECGTEWTPELIQTDDGGLREHEHWRPRPVISVF